ARQLARSRAPVLLLGETGVGKEVFAQGLHAASPVKDGPFVALNCGGLSRELLASELFGYCDGAFTGARRGGMMGKIEAANGGSLFLDEIGEMPVDLQPQLLRVLEQGEIYRLGENTPRKVRFRLIAATNRKLREEVAEGRFRMDLFYRVAVTSVNIPPLRERRGDIRELALHFLARFTAEHGLGRRHLAAATLARLEAYSWPGNVRELRNVIESMLLTSQDEVLHEERLPAELLDGPGTPAPGALLPADTATGGRRLEGAERKLIEEAIASAGGNLTRAARELGIAKSTLYLKLRKYGLDQALTSARSDAFVHPGLAS
ncbi:MAG: sigma 54-interacting transcriptional regulator, partial [Zoogloea sp.]|nr:sigma 54-interacting transcriptional regulator [Zoogloea sp.]